MDLTNFPTSPAAIKMLNTVTKGWYDKSYVGKWIYQVMGLEFDDVIAIFEELPLQAFPETATWGLRYHEEKYGIKVDESLTLEERRNTIYKVRNYKAPVNVYRLQSIAEEITGQTVEIIENISPYVFQITILMDGPLSDYNADALIEAINTIKPSHLAYEIVIETPMLAELFVGGYYQEADIIEMRQVI